MLSERKLTDRELKKRDEIVKAINEIKEEKLTDEKYTIALHKQRKQTRDHGSIRKIKKQQDHFKGTRNDTRVSSCLE